MAALKNGSPPPNQPAQARPVVARHVAASMAAVQQRAAGNNPRVPAPHVTASNAAVQKKTAAGPSPALGAPPRVAAPHVVAAHAAVQRKAAAPTAGKPPAAPAPHVAISQAAVQKKAVAAPAPPPVRHQASVSPRPLPPSRSTPAIRPASPPRLQAKQGTVQAKFPLRTFYDGLPDKILRELEAIQNLLADQGRVKLALSYLDSQVQEYLGEQGVQEGNSGRDGESVTAALNLALQDEEQRWMGSGRIKVSGDSAIILQDPKSTGGKSTGSEVSPPRESGKGPLPVKDFVEKTLAPVRALKDIGAGVHHGEYAHRLQWYIISYWFRVNFGAESLRRLYQLMGSQDLVIEHPTEKATISLWDAVLDVRGAWALSSGKTGELYENVGFAVPGFLTGILTDDETHPSAKVLKSYEGYLKNQRWSDDLPYLSAAVTWRKVKRVAEG